MNKRTLFLSVLTLLAVSVQAKIKLPHIICDNMVLQQQTEARLWGWSQAGKEVRVTTSWDGKTVKTKVDANGKWLVKVSTPVASYTPYSITFDDGDGKVTIQNVLAGEVWVCAGQSNMEMPVKGFGQCPVENFNHFVMEAQNPNGVRSVKIPSIMRVTPQEDADCAWKECTPQNVVDFSATGYFFARLVNKTLNIPVGLIEANKGGSRVESWLTKENLQRYTDDPTDSLEIVKRWPEWDYHRSLLWGNGTFNPILNYTVKGILFYQGCSNVGDPGNQYSERLKLLVEQWRSQFGLGEIPFYFVEIAPFWYDDVNGLSGALLREQQFRASQIIPNSGLVCTNDCVYPYEREQIHPTQKQKVGERLAFLALNEQYGMKSIIAKSPSFKEMTVKNDTVFVHFNDDFGGLNRFEGIEGFEVAGADQVYHKAEAHHFWRPGGDKWDDALIVFSPEVKKPVAIRYCFHNFQIGNLGNMGGLPLFPFKTDNW